MKKLMLAFSAVLLFGLIIACSQQKDSDIVSPSKEEEPVFKIGAIPDQNVSEISRRMDEFAQYLSEQTGLKVKFVPSRSYAALVTAFKREEVHLGWFGGLTSVQARTSVPGSKAIAQRPKDANFHSVFIAQKDLNVETLKDLKNLSFTFGSESSTSGHLMPRYYLIQSGIDPEKAFEGKPTYSGSHDKTWKLVESGAYQAGALNKEIWKSAVKEGKVNLNKVDVFYKTPPYYDYNWTINGNVNKIFGTGVKAKVKNALLSMGKQQSDILELFHTEKFIETNNKNYAAIEEVAKKIDIIK